MHMKDSIPSSMGSAAQRKLLVLLSVQAGIIDRDQALDVGLSARQISYRLNSGAWQRVYPGVYATFTGQLTREARLWAAVRLAGDGAMVSHETAAEVHGMIDKPAPSIHVTVPLSRRPTRHRPGRGIVIHRSDQSREHLPGPFKLPLTRVDDTVLDLVAAAPTFDHAYTWISRAVFRNLVTTSALRGALARRSRFRWRAWLNDAFAEARDGALSPLELRYVGDVERAHRLPVSQHQARRQINGKTHYKDNWYPEYRLAVEIDGPAYHESEQVQQDKDRDNANLAADDVKTFRFGPVAVTERACETAAMVAVTLQRNGWHGVPRPCRRAGCTVGRAVSQPRAS
jgi:very-short-patch-repair endonuclease